MSTFSDLSIIVITEEDNILTTPFQLLSQRYASLCEERLVLNNKIYEHLDEFFNNAEYSGREFLQESAFPDNDCKLALLKALKYAGWALEFASNDLKNDEMIVLTAAKSNLSAIKFASAELKIKRDFLLKLLKLKCVNHYEDFNMFAEFPQFANDELVISLILKQNPMCLKYAPSEFQISKEFALELVMKNGRAIQFIPEHLIDREIVKVAIKNSKHEAIIALVPEKFRQDEELVLLDAKKKSPFPITAISNKLLSEREFALKIAKLQGYNCLRELSEELRKDRDIILAAVKSSPLALADVDPQVVDENLLREIVTLAANKDVYQLRCTIASGLAEDREFVLNCISGASNVVVFLMDIPSSLSGDVQFVEELIDSQTDYYSAICYNDYFNSLSVSQKKRIIQIDPRCLELVDQYDEEYNEIRREMEFKYVLHSSLLLPYFNQLSCDREMLQLAVKEHLSALEYASDDLKKDKELAMQAILFDSSNFNHVSEELKQDTELLEIAISRDYSLFSYAPESWKNSREMVLKVIRNSLVGIPNFLGDSLNEDRDIVLEYVKRTGSIEYIPQEFKQDREIVQKAVEVSGREFNFAGYSIQQDKDLLIIALRNEFDICGLVNYNKLLNDRLIAFESCRNNVYTLEILPEKFKDDEEIVFTTWFNNDNGIECFENGTSDRLKNDICFLRKLSKVNGNFLQFISEELRSDREIVLNAITQYGRCLEFASEELRSDKKVILTGLTFSSDCYQFASDELKSDPDILEALRKWLLPKQKYLINGISLNKEIAEIALEIKALNDFDFSYRNDRQFALFAVNVNMENLLHVSNRLKLDRNFILEIDTIIGAYEILHIPIQLRNDKEIALKSLEQNGKSIMYLSEDLQNEFKIDRQIMLKAVKSNAIAFLFASEELKHNEEFVMECASLNGQVLHYLPIQFAFNRQIALECVKNSTESLFYVHNQFLNDREIIMSAASNSSSTPNGEKTFYSFFCASFEMRNDPEIVMKALERDVYALKAASYEIVSDRKFIERAMDVNIEALAFSHYSLRYNVEFLKEMNKENRIVEKGSKKLRKAIDFNGLLGKSNI